ncbi:hypothetical protein C8R44DRAFT_870883 [Mycena epipterygia]|nr:hypothetical protein C8R44DRAFT_870883 [Mycena epipterygia]
MATNVPVRSDHPAATPPRRIVPAGLSFARGAPSPVNEANHAPLLPSQQPRSASLPSTSFPSHPLLEIKNNAIVEIQHRPKRRRKPLESSSSLLENLPSHLRFPRQIVRYLRSSATILRYYALGTPRTRRPRLAHMLPDATTLWPSRKYSLNAVIPFVRFAYYDIFSPVSTRRAAAGTSPSTARHVAVCSSSPRIA